ACRSRGPGPHAHDLAPRPPARPTPWLYYAALSGPWQIRVVAEEPQIGFAHPRRCWPRLARGLRGHPPGRWCLPTGGRQAIVDASSPRGSVQEGQTPFDFPFDFPTSESESINRSDPFG